MSNKLPLPARFSDDAMSYSLVYIPGLPADTDPRYSVEPNVTSMRPIGRNVQSVNITGKGAARQTGDDNPGPAVSLLPALG